VADAGRQIVGCGTAFPAIYTIGHSNHPAEHFAALLKAQGVEVVTDVRSAPYSRMNPQYNREALRRRLADEGLRYVFAGRELGARSEDPECYENGRVQYDRLAKTELFHRGIEGLRREAVQHRVAIMCAEKEPLACHRTLLVARFLDALGSPVWHILADGRLESHKEAVTRMRKGLNLPESDLFRSSADVIEEAYRMQGERMAYTRTTPDERG